jgi:hypothetical protein
MLLLGKPEWEGKKVKLSTGIGRFKVFQTGKF